MKYILYLLLLINYCSIGQTQNSVYPDAPFSNLYLIDVLDSHIYTIGSCGTMMISTDNGLSWKINESPISNGIIDIDILPNTNGKKAIILTQQIVLLYDLETNTSKTISNDNLKLSAGKYKSLAVKGNMLYIVSNSSIHKSTIGVYNWTRLTKLNLGNDYPYAIDYTENYIWIGTNNGNIIKIGFADGNVEVTADLESRINYLDMVKDNLGYVIVKDKYNIQKTTDGAKTFSILQGMPEAITPVGWGDNNIMSINTNRIYSSFDGGQSSTKYSIPDDGYSNLINNYHITSDGVMYFVGKALMVMKSNDFAQSFIHLNKSKREDLYSISFNSKGEGYAIGGYSTFIQTTDYGENWNLVDLNISQTKSQINTIAPIGQNRFLLGHQNGTSLVENGVVLKTDPIPCIKIMKSKVKNHIIAARRIGSEYQISKSIDNGNTWTDMITAPVYVNDIKESNTGKIFITGENGTLITSEDGGANWKILNIGGIDKRIIAMDFIDDKYGILSVGNTLYLTEDGGETTSLIKSGYAMNNIHIIDRLHFLTTSLSSQRTTISESINQGKTWKLTNNLCAKSNKTFFDGDKTIWLAQDGGHINKHTVLKTNKIENISQKDNITIYPNPVVKGKTISIKNKNLNLKAISIYELYSGKTVIATKILFGDQIDTKTLDPGSYILKLVGQFETYYKKFIVVN